MAEVKAERSAVPGCISQGLECQAKELKLHSVGHRKPLKIFFFSGCFGSCCAWAFSSCGERWLLFVAVLGLLIAVASLVAEHRP